MSISEEVSNSEGMSNSDAKIRNVEVQIIPFCIRYQTVGRSYWDPSIGQFMYYEIGLFPTTVLSLKKKLGLVCFDFSTIDFL